MYFVTAVTHDRAPLLVKNYDLFDIALHRTIVRTSCEVLAWALLPDHFHGIIVPTKHDLSKIMQVFKLSFSTFYRGRAKAMSGKTWQSRFWDHAIRDEDDYIRHVDYIHYNAVKHGLARTPLQWEHSSFHQFIQEGQYDEEWGRMELNFEGAFGE